MDLIYTMLSRSLKIRNTRQRIPWRSSGASTAGDTGLIPGWGIKILQLQDVAKKQKTTRQPDMHHWIKNGPQVTTTL